MLCPSLRSNCSRTCHGIQSSKFMLNQVWGFRKLIKQPDMTPALRKNLYLGNLLCIERSWIGHIMSTWIQVPSFISISWNSVWNLPGSCMSYLYLHYLIHSLHELYIPITWHAYTSENMHALSYSLFQYLFVICGLVYIFWTTWKPHTGLDSVTVPPL